MLDSLHINELRSRMTSRYKGLDMLEQEINDLKEREINLVTGTKRTPEIDKRIGDIQQQSVQKREEFEKIKKAYEFELIAIYSRAIEIFEQDQKENDNYMKEVQINPKAKRTKAFEDMVRFPQELQDRYGTFRTYINTNYERLLIKYETELDEMKKRKEKKDNKPKKLAEMDEIDQLLEMIDSVNEAIPETKEKQSIRNAINMILPKEQERENKEER